MDPSVNATTPTNLIPQQNLVQPPAQPKVSSSPVFTDFVWKFFSVISWALLFGTSLEGYYRDCLFFSLKFKNENLYMPLTIHLGSLQGFYLIILFFGFFNYAYLGLYKQDAKIINPMFDKFAKFHFVPLLLVSFINILMQQAKNDPTFLNIEGEFITDLIFTLIALASLLFIYVKTELAHEWFIVLTIKKGVYSILITLLWYNFYYTMIIVGYLNQSNFYDFVKGAEVTSSIFIGCCVLIFSVIFNDIIAATTNFLIYTGMVNAFFGPTGKGKAQKQLTSGVGDGVLEIIMMITSFGFMLFLIFKRAQNLTENIGVSCKPC